MLLAILLIPAFLISTPTQAIENQRHYSVPTHSTPWYDGSWAYRKSFTVNGTIAGAQTNYQLRLTTFFGNGVDSGTNVYLNGKCSANFTDIRFTQNDGTTLLDYWVESMYTSANATVWVEFNSIPVAPNAATFFLYYGNAAALSVSNGINTFIQFDNFDTYVNGTAINGQGGWVGTGNSTVINTPSKSSSNSLWISRGPSSATKTSTPSANKSYMYWIYKLDACNSQAFQHGDGSTVAYSFVQNTEVINYINPAGGIVSTGFSTVADTWREWRIRDLNFTTDRYTIEEQYRLVSTNTPMFVSVAPNGIYGFFDNLALDVGFYVDDVCVTNWTNPEPAIGLWGTELALGPNPTVQNAKVFTSYISTGDWLITLLYTNLYEPYYSDGSAVESYFYIQMYDVAGTTLLAQTKCPAYGFKPGCIYLNPSMVSSLEWGLAYRIRVYGNLLSLPYGEYVLTPPDWMGSDLTRLDSWAISTATQMETYYALALTTQVTGKGLVLNSTGGPIFDTNIPALSTIRPNIFETVNTGVPLTRSTFTQPTQQGLVWQTLLGPYITSAFTNMGTSMSVSGSTVGAVLGFIFYAIVAAVCFPSGTAVAAISIPFLILITVWYLGLLPLAALGFILAVLAFLILWGFYWLKAA